MEPKSKRIVVKEPRQISRKPRPASLSNPRPDVTVCVRARGDAMSPLIEDGFIVAIDTSRKDCEDLEGQIVAARGPEGELRLKYLHGGVLVPHNRQRPSIPMARGWRIEGAVIWWIGRPEIQAKEFAYGS